MSYLYPILGIVGGIVAALVVVGVVLLCVAARQDDYIPWEE